MSVDNRNNPEQLRISIKQSMTDPFCKAVDIFLGTTSNNVCPIKGILSYLAIRGNQKGPLFVFEDSKSLTRQRFSSALDSLLNQFHINTDHYNTHSFQIGAEISARQAKVPDTDKDDGQMEEQHLPVLHQNIPTRAGKSV